MKSYEEMAKSVLARRDQYKKEQKQTARLVGAGVLSLALLLGVGAWFGRDSKAPSVAPPSPNGSYIYNMAEQLNWQKAADVRAKADAVHGVAVPAFIAYDGDIYSSSSRVVIQDDTELLSGKKVHFREKYTYDAYHVKGAENTVAIFINGGFMVYERKFDLDLGVDCSIVCTANVGTDFGVGEKLWGDDNAVIYEAKRLQGESSGQREYIVDVSALLKRELPEAFGDDENHAEYRWLAVGAAEDIPADGSGSYAENTSHLISEKSADYFGGMYLNDTGYLTVVLTQDTADIRRDVCKDLGVEESRVVFVEGKYSYKYLTSVHEAVTQKMMDRKVPFVVTCGVYEMQNRVVVGVTDMSESKLAEIRALDPLGGAIVFEKAEAMTFG